MSKELKLSDIIKEILDEPFIGKLKNSLLNDMYDEIKKETKKLKKQARGYDEIFQQRFAGNSSYEPLSESYDEELLKELENFEKEIDAESNQKNEARGV